MREEFMNLFRRVKFAAIVVTLPIVIGCQAMTAKTRVENPQEAAITKSVRAKLLAEKTANFTRVDVATNGGIVDLSGIVTSLDARERAVKLAWEVSGVETVVNHLEVEK
jgi:hyperosmotically inducible protein